MDQLPLENFENSRIELLVCQNSLIVSFVKSWPLVVGRIVDFVKSWPLVVGRIVDYGK
jgi:hypothetical protein